MAEWEGVDPMVWARETEARLQAVYRTAVDLLADEILMPRSMGGRIPIVTGNLRRSLLASTAGMPSVGAPDQRYTGSDVGLVTATLKVDQDIWLGFQANYALRVNYGFVGQDSLGRNYNQEGAHFLEAATAAWPIIVELAAEHVQRKVMSRARG